MCTAITYKTKDHYFGRNLDFEFSYGETITITPRNFEFSFAKQNHYAIIGAAHVSKNYPLYYDATNEAGLSMAGLLFPNAAFYQRKISEKTNLTPYEFIPYILTKCENIPAAKELLKNINLIDVCFSKELPLSPLHWIISDKSGSITVEPLKDGLKIYDNPVGVLTNSPTFDFHMLNLNNYINISANEPNNNFSDKILLKPYSRGMGAIGLPGDLSSCSRFVKAAFSKLNSISNDDEISSVNQFFHILGSVSQIRGLNILKSGAYEITIYSSCCNTDKGIYYYTTYDNSQISGIDMHKEDLDSSSLISYSMQTRKKILIEN